MHLGYSTRRLADAALQGCFGASRPVHLARLHSKWAPKTGCREFVASGKVVALNPPRIELRASKDSTFPNSSMPSSSVRQLRFNSAPIWAANEMMGDASDKPARNEMCAPVGHPQISSSFLLTAYPPPVHGRSCHGFFRDDWIAFETADS